MTQLQYNGQIIEIPDLKSGEYELDTLAGFPGYQKSSNLDHTQKIDLPDQLDKTLILKKENLIDTQPISIIRKDT